MAHYFEDKSNKIWINYTSKGLFERIRAGGVL